MAYEEQWNEKSRNGNNEHLAVPSLTCAGEEHLFVSSETEKLLH
jgi:hypothetical protein